MNVYFSNIFSVDEELIENYGALNISQINDLPLFVDPFLLFESEKEEYQQLHKKDIQIMFRFTWYATPADVSTEVNDGRGPSDFKISRGNKDKTIVEYKLASNTQLRRNLEKQVEIYKKASQAKKDIKVILYFSPTELAKVNKILNDLNLHGKENIVLIDAGKDTKVSASKA